MQWVLRIILVMLASSVLPASAAPTVLMGPDDAQHLLGRAGFGVRPADLVAFAQLSREEAVDRLLAETRAESAAPPAELNEYISPSRLRALSDDERKEMQTSNAKALRAWWLGAMLGASTPAEQVRERMTLFWHNHFVSSLQKVKSAKLMLDQNRLLRRHALGNFGDLLHSVSKDPAMVIYLDSATNRKGSPNENFAREVMELFTLGEGHYTEQDGKEAARAFTGWSVEPDTGEFRWRPLIHDSSSKTLRWASVMSLSCAFFMGSTGVVVTTGACPGQSGRTCCLPA